MRRRMDAEITNQITPEIPTVRTLVFMAPFMAFSMAPYQASVTCFKTRFGRTHNTRQTVLQTMLST